MNINQIRYFIELYKIRSFSKAAANLSISQPALSLQIQKLEEEFDYLLVDRHRKPLEITMEGELFFEKSIKIIQMMDDLHQLSFEIDDEISGQIRIGIIPTLSPYLVSLVINLAKQKFPELKIEIVELITKDILTKLDYNELDAGILSTPVKAKNFVFLPVFYEKFFLYVSEDHALFKKDKINLSEIDPDELWYLSEGNCFQNQVNSVCSVSSQMSANSNFRYISSSIESLKRIVETQGGITFIPELATLNVPSEYEDLIKSLAYPEPSREISVAYLKSTGMKKLVKAFVDVILESVPPRMKEKPENPALDTNL